MKLKLVKIVWRDATSVDAWTDATEIIPECHEIVTVGILVSENLEVISVALNRDVKGDAFSCFIHIPKAWIIKRTNLR